MHAYAGRGTYKDFEIPIATKKKEDSYVISSEHWPFRPLKGLFQTKRHDSWILKDAEALHQDT